MMQYVENVEKKIFKIASIKKNTFLVKNTIKKPNVGEVEIIRQLRKLTSIYPY